MNIGYYIPYRTAFEALGRLNQQIPYLNELFVPNLKSIRNIINDPVAATHFLTSFLRRGKRISALAPKI